MRLRVTVDEHLGAHADDSVCHLVTRGRTSGRPRTIEIWFATDGVRPYHQGWTVDSPLSSWAESSLPVEIAPD